MPSYPHHRHFATGLILFAVCQMGCMSEEIAREDIALSAAPYTFLAVESCGEKSEGQVDVMVSPGSSYVWQNFCSADSAVQFRCRAPQTLAYRMLFCENGCELGKCLAPLFNIVDFGAKGDGIHDDGPAFQAALDAANGGGRVYLPSGTYLVRQILLLGDHTEVFGDGPSSTVRRSNDTYTVAVLHDYLGNGQCTAPTGYSGRVLFMNRNYSCGTVGITLRDFHIDGGLVTNGPDAVTIALSGTKATHIHHLTFTNLPQDGIFMRNGGQNTLIEDNSFDGYNMRWFNGGAVNIEMWSNANYPTKPNQPVIVRNNVFLATGPAVCSTDKLMTCTRDADCAANGTCITEAMAVHANIPQATIPGSTPYLQVLNNHIRLTNRQYAISCKRCKESRISGNTISALADVAPYFDDGASGRYSGIHVLGGDHVIVENNTLDSNGLKNDERGILVDGGTNVYVMNNVIKNRLTRYGLDSIAVRTTNNFRLYKNTVMNSGGGNGISIGGGCADFIPETGYGSVIGNQVSTPTLVAPKFPILIRKTPSIYLNSNGTTPYPSVKTEC